MTQTAAACGGRRKADMGQHVQVADLKIWAEQAGEGPDVLLIGGFGNTVESWRYQFDGLRADYRLTAFDIRGTGRTEMLNDEVNLGTLTDDAAGVMQALGMDCAHVAGVSGGTLIGRELALQYPQLVRSLVLQNTWTVPDARLRAFNRCVRWMIDAAHSEREFLEAVFLPMYSGKAHNDGTVQMIIADVLNLPYKHEARDVKRLLDALANHTGEDRLREIKVPTLVLAGDKDGIVGPKLSREVAGRIPGARFEIMVDQGHQAFEEAPDIWNAKVIAFWQRVEGECSSSLR
jgi:3-oxoadipate enol-lactonase